MSRVDLSLVIPAWNEAARIRSPLAEIGEYLAEQPYASEVVVVDDGSGDGTFALLQELAPTLPVPLRAVRYASNRGKGHAIKVGFAEARGTRILFSDADLSTPIGCTERLLAALDAGADLAIGSRKTQGSTISVRQPWWRETLGRGFTTLVRLAIVEVTDVTCGFKAFRAEAGKHLFEHLRVNDWSFDAELLFLADREGYRITEVPVEWHDEAGTKVDLRRDVLASLAGLARIRWNALRGRYAEPLPVTLPLERFQSDLPESAPRSAESP